MFARARSRRLWQQRRERVLFEIPLQPSVQSRAVKTTFRRSFPNGVGVERAGFD